MRDHPEQHNAGRPPGLPTQGSRVAALLREMLERAERGELRCIAIATVNTDDSIGTAWTNDGEPCVFTLVGAVAEIQRALLEPPKDD